MDGYQSATGSAHGAPGSTIFSTSDAPSSSSNLTSTSWSSYNSSSSLAQQPPATADDAIAEEQEDDDAEPEGKSTSTGNTVTAARMTSRPAPGTAKRQRVTLVCAECKRLKLQCDRTKPHCLKCIRRGSQDKCVYSENAMNRHDIVTVEARLRVVEEELRSRPSERIDDQPLPFASLRANGGYKSSEHKRKQGHMRNRALLAASRSCGASLAINLENASKLWIDELGYSNALEHGVGMQAFRIHLQPSRGISEGECLFDFVRKNVHRFSSVNDELIARSTKQNGSLDDPNLEAASAVGDDDDDDTTTRVTPDFVAFLPSSPAIRSLLFDHLEYGQRFHDAPSINVKWVRDPVESMMRWAAAAAASAKDTSGETAVEGAGTTASPSRSRKKPKKIIIDEEPAPTLSFFAAAAAALAVGAQLYLQKLKGVGAGQDILGAAGGGGEFPTTGLPGSSSSVSSNASPATRPRDPRDRNASEHLPEESTTREITSELATNLISISQLAISIHRARAGYATYDPHYIYAGILHAHFLLQFDLDGATIGGKTRKGKGKQGDSFIPSLHPDLPRVLASLVSDARIMGLNLDADDISFDRFDAFEKEMRRRMWWEIVVLDWNVANSFNTDCLIHENSRHARMPTELDESESYTGLSNLPQPKDETSLNTIAFFIQKCTFVQAVKRMKTVQLDSKGRDTESPNLSASDQAMKSVSIIDEWIAALPNKLRLPHLSEIATSFQTTSSVPPHSPPMSSLQPPDVTQSPSAMSVDVPLKMSHSAKVALATRTVQQCMLAARGHHAKVRVFMPFIKELMRSRGSLGNSSSESKIALSALPDVGYIIEISSLMLSASKYACPAKYMRYSFGRLVFDAAVVFAYIAIREPIHALQAVASIRLAVSLLQEVGARLNPHGKHEGVNDSTRVLSALLQKVEAAKDDGLPSARAIKRKWEDDEQQQLSPFMGTFNVPFVGAAIRSVGQKESAATGDFPEAEAIGVSHPRATSVEDNQPSPTKASRPVGDEPPRHSSSRHKASSVAEPSTSSSSSKKHKIAQGVTIRSRIRAPPENKKSRSSTSSRGAPTTTRPRAESSASSPLASGRSFASDPAHTQGAHDASRNPSPIHTGGLPMVSMDVQPSSSPTHYMRPPSALSQTFTPLNAPTEYRPFSDPGFASHPPQVVPSHMQMQPQPQRPMPSFTGQFPTYPHSMTSSPQSQFGNSPHAYQPEMQLPVAPRQDASVDMNNPMSMQGVHGIDNQSFHMPAHQVANAGVNATFVGSSSMNVTHPTEQSMAGPSQQNFYPYDGKLHPPMEYEQQSSQFGQTHPQQSPQPWMNPSNPGVPRPSDWKGPSSDSGGRY